MRAGKKTVIFNYYSQQFFIHSNGNCAWDNKKAQNRDGKKARKLSSIMKVIRHQDGFFMKFIAVNVV